MLRRIPIIALLCALAALTAWTQQAHIMSWKEYFRHSPHTWPHILDLATPKGHLFYFGSNHTMNPGDPQVAEIEKAWAVFHPDIAFNEGGDPPTEKTIEEAVIRHGESGLVRYLAARDNVPVHSIDPTLDVEVFELRKLFPTEQVKLFFVLRQITEYERVQQATEDTLEEQMQEILRHFSAVPGLEVGLTTIAELDASCRRNLPKLGSYKDARPDWFDPVKTNTFLGKMGRRSSEIRDLYMINLLVAEVKQGKRVFAVVGGTHVVMQEPALRSFLR